MYRERKLVVEKRDIKKKKKKDIPYAVRTPAVLGKTGREMRVAVKKRKGEGREKEKENEITRSYLICRR